MFPEEFVKNLSGELGAERAAAVIDALGREPEVSVRVNPFKMTLSALRDHFGAIAGDPVPWASDEAFYLTERPSFTFDPLFHAGAYYVQEASSMYVGKLVERAFAAFGTRDGLEVLDLCAAPGGKSTQLLSHLGASSRLTANEVMASRVAVLAENVAKWGCGNAAVTSSDPSRFSGGRYDIIVVDAPCSGEGMFRKDGKAVENWSLGNVQLCAQRQRRILGDVWPSLVQDGFLVYSTCTFNHFEDEGNVDWICSELGAECLEMRHFYPGESRGEGFFAALLRKTSEGPSRNALGKARTERAGRRYAGGGAPLGLHLFESQFPEADLALSNGLDRSAYPVAELSLEDALKFLSKEPLVFPDYPLGLVLVTFKGLALGFVKNLGRRSNNLHPMPRRIRSQYR